MAAFRLDRFEHTDTDSSVLVRLRGEIVGGNPKRISDTAVLVVLRSGTEILRVPPLRGSVSLERSTSGVRWSGAFGLPRSAIAGRRQRRLGSVLAGRRRLHFELIAEGLEKLDLPLPEAIPQLELVGGPQGRRASRPLRRSGTVPSRLRLPLAGALAAAVAAAAVTAAVPVRESATALFMASPLSSRDPALSGLPILRARGNQSASFQTARDEIASRPVARLTAQALGPPWTPRRIEEDVTVAQGPSAAIVAVTGRAGSQEMALRLTRQYVASTLALRSAIVRPAVARALAKAQERLAALSAARPADAAALPADVVSAAQQVQELAALSAAGDPTLQLVRDARLAVPPSLLHRALLVVAALFCGGFLGAFAGWVDRRMGRRSVATARRVVEITGAQILATLPPPESLVLPVDTASGAVAQAISSVYTLLEWGRDRPRTIAVVSAVPGDGATTAALALLSYASGRGTSVGLVDLDWLQLSAVHRLGVRLPRHSPDDHAWYEHVERAPRIGTLLMSVPLSPPDAADIRTHLRRAETMTELVLVDTPPMSVSGDALALVGLVDAVVVVACLDRTPEPELAKLCETLGRAGASITGVLLFAPRGAPRYAEGSAAARRRRRGSRGLWADVATSSSTGPSASSTHSL